MRPPSSCCGRWPRPTERPPGRRRGPRGRQRLVSELAERTGAVLAGRPVPPGQPFPAQQQRALMEAGLLEVLPAEQRTGCCRPRPTRAVQRRGRCARIARHRRARGPRSQRRRQSARGFHPGPPGACRPAMGAHRTRHQGGRRKAAQCRAKPWPAGRRPQAPPGAGSAEPERAWSSSTTRQPPAPRSSKSELRTVPGCCTRSLRSWPVRVSTLSRPGWRRLGNAAVDTFYVQAEGTKMPAGARAAALSRAIEGALQREPI